jgi:hypothetical protein
MYFADLDRTDEPYVALAIRYAEGDSSVLPELRRLDAEASKPMRWLVVIPLERHDASAFVYADDAASAISKIRDLHPTPPCGISVSERAWRDGLANAQAYTAIGGRP